jgi:hypothetical protein
MPPRPVLAVLLLLATLPPFVAQASGSVVGSYTMFNRIERYHVELSVVLPEGERRVLLRSSPRTSRTSLVRFCCPPMATRSAPIRSTSSPRRCLTSRAFAASFTREPVPLARDSCAAPST